MFLRDAWYVAAWATEVVDTLMAVEMLDQRIVLFRKVDGSFAALEDACPHRKVPLSMGRLDGDTVECGYHGLKFDGSGACVHSPSSRAIPRGVGVRSYPAQERYGLLWVWMGEPERADTALIIHIENWGDPAWGVNFDQSMVVDCNYLYLVDNLLDPTHVAWVHPTSFGDESCEGGSLSVTSDAAGVTVSRWMYNVEPAPFYGKFLKFDGRCDRKQHYEMRYPSNAFIRAIFTPAGTGGDGKPHDPAVFLMDSYNFLTPINAGQTRYFWFQIRNFAPDDRQVSDEFATGVRDAFAEDRRILNAVQKGMDHMQSPNISLKSDLGAFRFRRGLELRIDAENRPVPQVRRRDVVAV